MSDKAVPIRRIITGHDANNKAKVIIDDVADNIRSPRAGQFTTLMWCTDDMPASMPVGENVEDMGARKLGTYPPIRPITNPSCIAPRRWTISSFSPARLIWSLMMVRW